MYQPVEFKDDAPQRAYAHIVRNPFGILITGGGTSLTATHLPLLLDDEQHPSALLGHFAIRNVGLAAAPDGADVLAIFPGPHAYVSPNLYRVENPAPTWNYTAVHVYGSLHRVSDQEMQAILQRSVRQFEGPTSGAWTLDRLPVAALRSLARGIAGFRVDITRIEGGYKLSQNKVAEDVRAIAEALEGSTCPNDRAVAHEMRCGGMASRFSPSSTDPNTWLGPLPD